MPTIRRSKDKFKSARAAWKDIAKDRGISLKKRNINPDHTKKSWQWKVTKK